jgi:hypothetical protein
MQWYLFGNLFNKKEIEESLFARTNSIAANIIETKIHQQYSHLHAEPGKSASNLASWCLLNNQKRKPIHWETIIKGLKQGASGKNPPKECSNLCRMRILEKFLSIQQQLSIEFIHNGKAPQEVVYAQLKKEAKAYQMKKQFILDTFLQNWIRSGSGA